MSGSSMRDAVSDCLALSEENASAAVPLHRDLATRMLCLCSRLHPVTCGRLHTRARLRGCRCEDAPNSAFSQRATRLTCLCSLF